MIFIPNDKPSEILKPGKEPLDLPSSPISLKNPEMLIMSNSITTIKKTKFVTQQTLFLQEFKYLLSDDLINYVIIHELVHTRIKSHSKEFWDML